MSTAYLKPDQHKGMNAATSAYNRSPAEEKTGRDYCLYTYIPMYYSVTDK